MQHTDCFMLKLKFYNSVVDYRFPLHGVKVRFATVTQISWQRWSLQCDSYSVVKNHISYMSYVSIVVFQVYLYFLSCNETADS